MSPKRNIEYGPATLAELPAVVELCMQVEAQHERYWPLRWQRRAGLPEGYLRWFTKRMKDSDMYIAVARDRTPASGAAAPVGIPASGAAALVGSAGAASSENQKSKIENHPSSPIAGMVLASIIDEIPIYTFQQYAMIQDLAVRPEYRRRGIAQRLLAETAAWARTQGVNQLRLMVANQNPDARAVFEKAGFRPTYQEMVLPL
jgi:ribosomal protein S18 acetylase RimI-like enzyme